MHMNMLPTRIRRQQIVVRRAKQWGGIWGGALLMALTIGWFHAADCRQMADDLEVLEARYGRVKNVQLALTTAQTELQELEQREALVLELSERRPMLSLLGTLSRAAQQCEGNVSVRQIIWNAEGEAAHASAAGNVQPLLTLHGVGLNNVWVAQFAAALRNNEIMRDVQLTSTEQQTINNNAAHGYQLFCTFD